MIALALNHFRGNEKDLLLPMVIVGTPPIRTSGICYRPRKEEIIIDSRFYPMDKGLIIIPPDADDSVLAHEWRHHWQCIHGWVPDNNIPLSWGKGAAYKSAIIKYFESRTEMDALIYSLPYALTDLPLQWYEWILKSYKIPPPCGSAVGI